MDQASKKFLPAIGTIVAGVIAVGCFVRAGVSTQSNYREKLCDVGFKANVGQDLTERFKQIDESSSGDCEYQDTSTGLIYKFNTRKMSSKTMIEAHRGVPAASAASAVPAPRQ